MQIRASLRLRNDALISAREALGINQTQAAKACGISLEIYGKLERLDFSASGIRHIEKVCAFFELQLEDVAPEQMRGERVESEIVRRIDIAPQALLAARESVTPLLATPFEAASRAEMVAALDEALDALTFREREVVRLRYGLADGMAYTLDEVARIFKVSRARAGQIEARAVRKLRHPRRSKKLLLTMDDRTQERAGVLEDTTVGDKWGRSVEAVAPPPSSAPAQSPPGAGPAASAPS